MYSRHVAHSLYQGFFYFQNVTRFHITRVNVISFTPIISTACTAPIFTVVTTALQHYMQTKSEHRSTNVESAERYLCTPLRMALATSISPNSQWINTFARTKKIYTACIQENLIYAPTWSTPSNATPFTKLQMPTTSRVTSSVPIFIKTGQKPYKIAERFQLRS